MAKSKKEKVKFCVYQVSRITPLGECLMGTFADDKDAEHLMTQWNEDHADGSMNAARVYTVEVL